MEYPAGFDSYLTATWFIDCDNPAVSAYAHQVASGCVTDEERAVRIFYAVRDGVRYDPYSVSDEPLDYQASSVLARRVAYCVPKAVLLTALARSLGIPARLGFADVRNHLASEKLLARLKSDLFVFHGYTEMWLGNRWIKATPAFNIELCQRFDVKPLDFDGIHDALFHEFSTDGRRHMEYVSYRGTFADLPLEEILDAFDKEYGGLSQVPQSNHDHDELFDGAAGVPAR